MGIGIAGGSIGISNLFEESSKSETRDENQNNDELVIKLKNLKKAYDSELITKEEFAASKAKLLGI